MHCQIASQLLIIWHTATSFEYHKRRCTVLHESYTNVTVRINPTCIHYLLCCIGYHIMIKYAWCHPSPCTKRPCQLYACAVVTSARVACSLFDSLSCVWVLSESVWTARILSYNIYTLARSCTAIDRLSHTTIGVVGRTLLDKQHILLLILQRHWRCAWRTTPVFIRPQVTRYFISWLGARLVCPSISCLALPHLTPSPSMSMPLNSTRIYSQHTTKSRSNWDTSSPAEGTAYITRRSTAGYLSVGTWFGSTCLPSLVVNRGSSAALGRDPTASSDEFHM